MSNHYVCVWCLAGKPELEVLQSIQRKCKGNCYILCSCIIWFQMLWCLPVIAVLLFWPCLFSPIFHLELHLFLLVYPVAPFSCFLSFLIKGVAVEVEHFCSTSTFCRAECYSHPELRVSREQANTLSCCAKLW